MVKKSPINERDEWNFSKHGIGYKINYRDFWSMLIGVETTSIAKSDAKRKINDINRQARKAKKKYSHISEDLCSNIDKNCINILNEIKKKKKYVIEVNKKDITLNQIDFALKMLKKNYDKRQLEHLLQIIEFDLKYNIPTGKRILNIIVGLVTTVLTVKKFISIISTINSDIIIKIVLIIITYGTFLYFVTYIIVDVIYDILLNRYISKKTAAIQFILVDILKKAIKKKERTKF